MPIYAWGPPRLNDHAACRQLKEATARCAKLEQQRSAAEVRANKAEADLDSVRSKGAAKLIIIGALHTVIPVV